MFKTKNLVHKIDEVPVHWIFEKYCGLKEKLKGQDVKIKSLFNPKDKVPSMSLYVKDGTYKFKDFSSGKAGTAIDLVKELFSLTYHKACERVIEDYNDFVLHNNGGYDIQEFKEASRYKVTAFELRKWTTADQYYWTQFNIGSKLLEEYGVRPLASYTMEKDRDQLTIRGNHLYGYFTKEGELYKVYQPKTQDKKFLKVRDHIQGMDQRKGHHNLIITSSLKDVMALSSLKLGFDYLAPDSENSMIRHEVMKELLKDYRQVLVMFDYDEPGIRAMEKYKEKYPQVITATLAMSKDPADSIRDHGAQAVYHQLVSLLNRKFDVS